MDPTDRFHLMMEAILFISRYAYTLVFLLSADDDDDDDLLAELDNVILPRV
jgi:hypothetical protein